MKVIKCLPLLLFFGQTFAQTPTLTLLKGKITAQIKELNDVYVANLRSESTATTDSNGNFSIFVKVGDTLQFSGLQITTKKSIINENDAVKQLYVISLDAKVIPLQEVVIMQYLNINAVSLGILQKPAKVYTPAERKLRTATAAYPTDIFGPVTYGFSVGLDPVINAISGRTVHLKEEVTIEKKEKLLEKIEYTFHEDFFLERLKIPKDYLRGFWYYAIENSKLVSALNANNKMMARFTFADLSIEYLEIIAIKD